MVVLGNYEADVLVVNYSLGIFFHIMVSFVSND
jgi:hypothetical protein